MAQFKSKEEYEKIAAEGPELDTMFRIQTKDGPLNVPQKGTAPVLEEILKKYNTDGVTIHTRKGLTWFPTHAISKVDVEVL